MRNYERTTASTTIPLLMSEEDCRLELRRFDRNLSTARANALDVAMGYIRKRVPEEQIAADLRALVDRKDNSPLVPDDPPAQLDEDALRLLLQGILRGDTSCDLVASDLAKQFDLYASAAGHDGKEG